MQPATPCPACGDPTTEQRPVPTRCEYATLCLDCFDEYEDQMAESRAQGAVLREAMARDPGAVFYPSDEDDGYEY